ncbi:DUF1836 domain-containing protein [Sporomusa sphaeroides]|uniref:DUF1836 domain-containing protein n=1 Tax=Sporomusa sphaeroides DSM 2875 TaxID=1337886 RepID=A0ABP2C9H9_9FIRM|nr:DUF1836 domain-containing protein [Sporomusa sphaeroides]OLS55817.1 hypothetical protein SPSPH_31470 [Sporomusa sphaeroides DSM 2875]CVK18818.1 hypothetical protein SSPH_01462 [Sporomusa sphaeroides DSM 2875]
MDIIMEYNKETIQTIIESLGLTEDIQVDDIPDINLYMDQLLEFLNNRLYWLKRESADKGLTKTMINNYTKDQLLIPPQNRKYGRQHIMLLILISQLKSILSISDIKKIFAPILNDINTPDDDVIPLQEIYITFLELRKEQFAEFYDTFEEKVKYIESKTAAIETTNRNAAELLLIILMLVAQANASKRLAEKMIDTFFTDKEE